MLQHIAQQCLCQSLTHTTPSRSNFSVSTSIRSQTLLFVAPSKGAAALVEHEASAELDNVDDDYVWRGRRTYGPLLHSHTIHANEALNRVISTTWQTNRVPRHMLGSQEVLNNAKNRRPKHNES